MVVNGLLIGLMVEGQCQWSRALGLHWSIAPASPFFFLQVPLARVEHPLQPPVYRGTAFYSSGPRFRIALHTAVSPPCGSGRAIGVACPCDVPPTRAPCLSRPPLLQEGPPHSAANFSIIGARSRVVSMGSVPQLETSALRHAANWKKVLGIWLALVSRHSHCSEHFAGALTSEYKEVLLSQMLSRGTCAQLCFSLT